MRIYGLDFTSSPSKTKGLFLAVCELQGDTLKIERLVQLNAEKKDATSNPFKEWLKGSGEWANQGKWVAGIDFPFGMPIEAIERFGWLTTEQKAQSWTAYIGHIKEEYDKDSFRQCIEGWRHPTRTNDKGDPVRVRKLRLTDRLAKSGSPMNYFPPPVCPTFFEGSRLLMEASPDVSIIPVRPADANKVVVEAYPRLVVNGFIGPRAKTATAWTRYYARSKPLGLIGMRAEGCRNSRSVHWQNKSVWKDGSPIRRYLTESRMEKVELKRRLPWEPYHPDYAPISEQPREAAGRDVSAENAEQAVTEESPATQIEDEEPKHLVLLSTTRLAGML